MRARTPLAVAIVALCGVAAAARAAPDQRAAMSVQYDLAGRYEVLVDPGHRFEIADIAQRETGWTRVDTPAVNFGFSYATYWVSITVENATDEPMAWVVNFPRTLDRVTMYSRGHAGAFDSVQAGKKIPFAERPYQDDEVNFRLVLHPREEKPLWFRIQSEDTMLIRPLLMTEERYAYRAARKGLVSGAYFGALCAMSLFNLLVWASLRDPVYLLYVVFQVNLAVLLGALQHSTFQFLWPSWPHWAARSEMVFTGTSVLSGAIFARAFLGSRYLTKAVDRALVTLGALAALLTVTSLFTNHAYVQQFGLTLISTACVVIIVAGISAATRGSPNGMIFFVAWLILLMAGVMSGLAYMGLFTWEPFFVEVPRLGSFVEAMLLSLALARRIKLAQREKEEAQQRLIDQERALTSTLEKRVEERTRELAGALDELGSAQDRMVKQARLAALGHLVGGVAHEVGNPLNFVIGGTSEAVRRLDRAAEAMRAGRDAGAPLDAARRALRLAENGGERIKLIVENLRGHTRARTVVPEAVDVVAALENTLSLLEPQLERQRITVVRELAPVRDVPSRPGELSQVFLNVLLNACQAMPDGGTLTVRTAARGDMVDVTVSDTGPGVPPEHRASIFDPFFTTRSPSEGTGLGLSLSLQIIESHRGDLRLVPSDAGAVFVISLPTGAVDAEPSRGPAFT